MTNFNFKFLGAWLVIVASITGLQAQNDSTLKGKDEMVPAGVWNDVNGEYINTPVRDKDLLRKVPIA